MKILLSIFALIAITVLITACAEQSGEPKPTKLERCIGEMDHMCDSFQVINETCEQARLDRVQSCIYRYGQ